MPKPKHKAATFCNIPMMFARCKAVCGGNYLCLKLLQHDRIIAGHVMCENHADVEPKRCDAINHGIIGCFENFPHSEAHVTDSPSEHDYIRVKTTTCSGWISLGVRCDVQLWWEPPYYRFCDDHANQSRSKCYIADALPEIFGLILGKLQPYDRVAFALANKSCEKAVQAWGEIPKPTSVSERKIPTPRLIFITHPEECLYIDLSTYAGPIAFNRFVTGFSSNLTFWPGSLVAGQDQPSGYLMSRDFPTDSIAIPSRACFRPDPTCQCLDPDFDLSPERTGRRKIAYSPLVKAGSLMRVERTMREAHWLFKSAACRPLCLNCNTPITDGFHQQFVYGHDHSYEFYDHHMKVDIDGPPARLEDEQSISLFCLFCSTFNKPEIFFQWCQICNGEELSITALARAYWSTQKRH